MLNTELLIEAIRRGNAAPQVVPIEPPPPRGALPLSLSVWKIQAEAARAAQEAAALERATSPGPEFEEQLKEA